MRLGETRETTQLGETPVELVGSVQLHSVVLVGTRETTQPGETLVERVESLQRYFEVVRIREIIQVEAVEYPDMWVVDHMSMLREHL